MRGCILGEVIPEGLGLQLTLCLLATFLSWPSGWDILLEKLATE